MYCCRKFSVMDEDIAELGDDIAPNAVLQLQQLGHACGESAMAADLAAFVTLKQQRSRVVLSGRRRALPSPAGTNTSSK